ncbi:MAG: hypothetical protein ACYC0T_03065 [Ramlibacter sp.]
MVRALFATPVHREPQAHAHADGDSHAPWVRLVEDLPKEADPGPAAG